METFVFIHLDDEWIPAGKLRFRYGGRNSESIFAYGRKYLERNNAIAIDPLNLPLSKDEFVSLPGHQIFSAFRDSGPDAWGRYLLTKKFGRELSELEYIIASGPDRAGALAYGPTPESPKIYSVKKTYKEPIVTQYDLALTLKASQDALDDISSPELKSFLEYGSSLGGARPKAAITWRGSPTLAKLSVRLDTRREAVIEYASMSLAKKLGLNVPSIDLARVSNKDVFLIRRFDRDESGSPIAYISGLTAMKLHEQEYSRWSYLALTEAIKKLSDQPEHDLTELYQRVIFNILLNNDDDHPRNHGFVHVGSNRWRLSPLFDVVPRNQLGETFRLAMNIGQYGKEASKLNVISASKYFDMTSEQAEAIWNASSDFVEQHWEQEFANAGLSEREIDSFKNSIGQK